MTDENNIINMCAYLYLVKNSNHPETFKIKNACVLLFTKGASKVGHHDAETLQSKYNCQNFQS